MSMDSSTLNAALFLKARLNDAAGVREALSLGADPNALVDERSAVGVAAFYGCAEALAALLEGGGSPGALPGQKASPLEQAAKVGSLACVEALLRAGADPNGQGEAKEMTPLGAAAFGGHAMAARRLLEAGARPDQAGGIFGSPLGLCALFGNEATLRELLAFGARVDQRDDKGWTPLMCACNTGNLAEAKALLSAGADAMAVDREGERARGIAAKNGYEDLMELLGAHEALQERDAIERCARAGSSPSAPRRV